MATSAGIPFPILMASGRIPIVTDPEKDRPVGIVWDPNWKAPDSRFPSNRFIAGDPMNEATKRLRGRR